MKLESLQNQRSRGVRSDDVLFPDRQRSDLEIFDPRFDLPPGETQRMISLVERGQQPNNIQENRKVSELVWLTWVNPRFRLAMQQQAVFNPEKVLAEFALGVRTDHEVDSTFVLAAEVLQVHPEARDRFSIYLDTGDFFDRVKAYVEKLSALDNGGLNRTTNTLRMIRLWPKKATELRDYFFPLGERVDKVMAHLASAKGHWGRVVTAAECTLLFPELRQEILSSVTPDLRRRTQELAVMQRGARHPTGFGVLQHYLASLTILYADQAFVDDTGKVRIQLPALPADRGQALPARPQF